MSDTTTDTETGREDGDVEIDERVERSDVGVSITATLTRGTGTRDQEKLKAKVKRREYDAARAEMDRALEDLRAWSEVARDIQPTASDDREGQR